MSPCGHVAPSALLLQMLELVAHNKALIANHQRVISLVPKQLKVDSDVLRRAQATEKRIRAEETSRRLRELAAAQQSADVDREALKQRLTATIQKQNALIQEMTAEQVAYHAKRRNQITKYRAEIETLAKCVTVRPCVCACVRLCVWACMYGRVGTRMRCCPLCCFVVPHCGLGVVLSVALWVWPAYRATDLLWFSVFFFFPFWFWFWLLAGLHAMPTLYW